MQSIFPTTTDQGKRVYSSMQELKEKQPHLFKEGEGMDEEPGVTQEGVKAIEYRGTTDIAVYNKAGGLLGKPK